LLKISQCVFRDINIKVLINAKIKKPVEETRIFNHFFSIKIEKSRKKNPFITKSSPGVIPTQTEILKKGIKNRKKTEIKIVNKIKNNLKIKNKKTSKHKKLLKYITIKHEILWIKRCENKFKIFSFQ